MKIGPKPQCNPPGGEQIAPRNTKLEKTGGLKRCQDELSLSDQTRAKLAVLADRALAAENVKRVQEGQTSTEPTQPKRAGYEKSDIQEKAGPGTTAKQSYEISQRAKVERARQRLRAGYYERPEVREIVADKLADELTVKPSEKE